MKILIISDSHDNYDKLREAVSLGNEKGCEVLLHVGDFVSPPGVEYLKDFNGDVHMVWGNCEGEKIGMMKKISESGNITMHGNTMEEEFGGLKFYMNHYPDISENASLSGKYDICIYGHTHIYRVEKLENGALLLNPGEIHGYKTGTHTAMIFDTETKEVERVSL